MYSQTFLGGLLAAALSLGTRPLDTPADVATYVEYKSKTFDASLRYVNNSGVCETTQGVHTASGYIDVAQNHSLWFWFFAAREHPETAPFTLWLNGGPGCSSMIGLFQENGPCNVTSDGKTTMLNPYSWNSISNMIYLDQPVGAGFSYGVDAVNSTVSAAPSVWTAFQLLFEDPAFSTYQRREFIFATESYGGHYGPEFVRFFNEQNSKIDAGIIKAKKITVSALMINNGWFDPLIQFESYIDFAIDAPGYGPLVNSSVIKKIAKDFYSPDGCLAQGRACYNAGNAPESNEICSNASTFCTNEIQIPAIGDHDEYDLRQKKNSSTPFPPMYYLKFLKQTDIKEKIGAKSTYADCGDGPSKRFAKTGDDSRTLLPQLSGLVNSGLKVLIWAGDTDINCNWLGGYAAVLAMDWYGKETLHNMDPTNITVDGTVVAAVQNVGNFTFARIYASGHEVPAFQPRASLEIFKQVIKMEPLHSV